MGKAFARINYDLKIMPSKCSAKEFSEIFLLSSERIFLVFCLFFAFGFSNSESKIMAEENIELPSEQMIERGRAPDEKT